MTTRNAWRVGKSLSPHAIRRSIVRNAEKKAERRNTMTKELLSIECTPATIRRKYSIIPARSVERNLFPCEFQKIFAVSAAGKNGELRRQNVRVAVYYLLAKETTPAEAIAARSAKRRHLSAMQSQMDCIFPARFAEKCLLHTANKLAIVRQSARKLIASGRKKNV